MNEGTSGRRYARKRIPMAHLTVGGSVRRTVWIVVRIRTFRIRGITVTVQLSIIWRYFRFWNWRFWVRMLLVMLLFFFVFVFVVWDHVDQFLRCIFYKDKRPYSSLLLIGTNKKLLW